MNIVVTGENGFIGRWLIIELAQYEKYQITALIRKGSNIIKAVWPKVKEYL